MAIGKKVARALSFAHLAGFGAGASKAEDPEKDDHTAEGDDPKDQDRENVNSKSKSKAEDDEDKKQRPDESDEDYAKRMEEDDKKEPEKGDEPDAEDDDPDDEMRGKSASAAARRRERARCAAIFSSKFAAKNPALAANLAFNTALPRIEALALLESTPVAQGANLDRAARNPGIAAGGDVAGPSTRQSVSSSWDAAFKKASPRR